MDQFEKIPIEDRPHVLGLTATLINSNCKPDRILKEIHNLEITMHSKIARAENEEMIQAWVPISTFKTALINRYTCKVGNIYFKPVVPLYLLSQNYFT